MLKDKEQLMVMGMVMGDSGECWCLGRGGSIMY
jgi:hypothetical protein